MSIKIRRLAPIVVSTLGLAGDARTVTFTILGIESPRPLYDLHPGDTITISIRINGARDMYGLGASRRQASRAPGIPLT